MSVDEVVQHEKMIAANYRNIIWMDNSSVKLAHDRCTTLFANILWAQLYIGYTTSPRWRMFGFSMHNNVKPHCFRWARLFVIFTGTGTECKDLERSLIKAYRSNKRCKNIQIGGEQVREEASVGFIYVGTNSVSEAIQLADELRRLKRRAAAIGRTRRYMIPHSSDEDDD